MNPALSVLFFTTLSGAGLGLLFLLGIGQTFVPLPLSREIAVIPPAVGAILLCAGLAAAFMHLGRPARAWRAFSQWRSSWLSREGVAASATLLVCAAVVALVWFDAAGHWVRGAWGLLAAGASTTLWTTARIYTSLPTIRAWANGYVLPFFAGAALVSGALLLWSLLSLAQWRLPTGAALFLAVLAAALGWLKLAYWRFIDHTDHGADAGRATGLARLGSVRPAEAPHTETNFLLQEMAFRVARRHARRLRGIALACFAVVPCVVALLAATLRDGDFGLAASAFGLSMVGLFVERWLFFAEARHVVVGYYR
jgi:DMSO reductase anchor subunit